MDLDLDILDVPGTYASSIGGAGGGTPIPNQLTVTAGGTYALSSFTQIPSGVAVQVELFGAGGGGAGYSSSGTNGGQSGGTGAYLCMVVTPAQWALGGTLNLHPGGTGGIAAADGQAGGNCTLTVGSLAQANAHGGGGGFANNTGGAAGPAIPSTDLKTTSAKNGLPGVSATSATGANGPPSNFPAGGKGGLGSSNATAAGNGVNGGGGGGGHYNDGTGGNGGDCAAVLTWPV